MNDRKCGHVCCAKNCPNKSYNCKMSFFNFPREPKRARIWAMACGKEGILDVPPHNLFKSYRLCADHFEQKSFTNRFRNRLNPNAVPTLFPGLEGCSANTRFHDHTYSRPKLVRVHVNPNEKPENESLVIQKGTKVFQQPKEHPEYEYDVQTGYAASYAQFCEKTYFSPQFVKPEIIVDEQENEYGKIENPSNMSNFVFVKCEESMTSSPNDPPTFSQDDISFGDSPMIFKKEQTEDEMSSDVVDSSYANNDEWALYIKDIMHGIKTTQQKEIDITEENDEDSKVLELNLTCPENYSSSPQLSEEHTESALFNPDQSSSSETPRDFTTSPIKLEYEEILESSNEEKKPLESEEQIFEDEHLEEDEKLSFQDVKEFFSRFRPTKFGKYMMLKVSQLELTEARKKSKEFRRKCLEIYFKGPEEYRLALRGLFDLPKPQTLLRLIRSIEIKPGLNNTELFSLFKMKVDNFDDRNKHVVLCINEMSVKPSLFYDYAKDCSIGLAVDEKHGRVVKAGSKVCVLMVRGIYSDWRQPISYFFYNDSYSVESLINILPVVAGQLNSVGLKICGLTLDNSSKNIELSNLLSITEENPFFYIENQRVYFIFDVPHLLNSIRDTLIDNDFYEVDKIISWKFIKMYYEFQKKHMVITQKWTESHINPTGKEKTRVELSAQIFSYKLAAYMSCAISANRLPKEAQKTVEFLDRMDKLFDILNSTKVRNFKKFRRAFSGKPYQIEFLKDCLKFLEKLQVKSVNNINVTREIGWIKPLKVTINSIVLLWNHLNEYANFENIRTRRLNLESLENVFKKIKRENQNRKSITPVQFQRAFKKIQAIDLFKSGEKFCKADSKLLLSKLFDTPPEEVEVKPSGSDLGNNDFPQILHRIEYQKNENLQQDFVKEICGYLLQQTLTIHCCNKCYHYCQATSNLDESYFFCFSRLYNEGKLFIFQKNALMPYNDFINLLTNVEVIFQSNFEKFLVRPNFCNSFLELCEKLPFSYPCEQFPKRYSLKLYLRIRIFYTLKNVNKRFRNNSANNILWRNI